MKESGIKIEKYVMDVELKLGLMVHYMKVIGKTIKLMEKED